MMKMLTAHDFTKLAEELTLPVVVKDSLEHNCVSDENKMIMASLLTDMSASQLLLSLACTLRLIADHKSDEPDITKSLYYHAEFMLDDYAPYWRHEGKTLFPAEWIVHIQEDLELLHEILNLTRDAFAYRDDTIYNLCEILIDYTAAKIEADDNYTAPHIDVSDLQIDIEYPSNVIVFPMDRIHQSRT